MLTAGLLQSLQVIRTSTAVIVTWCLPLTTSYHFFSFGFSLRKTSLEMTLSRGGNSVSVSKSESANWVVIGSLGFTSGYLANTRLSLMTIYVSQQTVTSCSSALRTRIIVWINRVNKQVTRQRKLQTHHDNKSSQMLFTNTFYKNVLQHNTNITIICKTKFNTIIITAR